MTQPKLSGHNTLLVIQLPQVIVEVLHYYKYDHCLANSGSLKLLVKKLKSDTNQGVCLFICTSLKLQSFKCYVAGEGFLVTLYLSSVILKKYEKPHSEKSYRPSVILRRLLLALIQS